MKATIKNILVDGRLYEVIVSDDPKRPGMLIGRYQGNIPRVLYGKKWQKALSA